MVDIHVYDYARYDQSHSRTHDGGGFWTYNYENTPGQPNHPRSSSPSGASPSGKSSGSQEPLEPWFTSIYETKRAKIGTWVKVHGQVTVPPPLFGRSVIYIQDETAGVQVYMYYGDYPELSEGDWVEITGYVTEYHGERELKISSRRDVRRLDSAPLIEPETVNISSLDDRVAGSLINLTGTVSGFARDTIYLREDEHELKVYFKKTTEVQKPWVEKGENWRVTGILSQYAHTKDDVPAYRLLPRYESDVHRAGYALDSEGPPPLFLPVTGSRNFQPPEP